MHHSTTKPPPKTLSLKIMTKSVNNKKKYTVHYSLSVKAAYIIIMQIEMVCFVVQCKCVNCLAFFGNKSSFTYKPIIIQPHSNSLCLDGNLSEIGVFLPVF